MGTSVRFVYPCSATHVTERESANTEDVSRSEKA